MSADAAGPEAADSSRSQRRRVGPGLVRPGVLRPGGPAFRQELADVQGRDPTQEQQAQLRVVDALAGEFQQSAGSRDWTIADRRVRQLVGDAIGLSMEFQHDHGYEPMGARWAAVRECLEGEQARELIAQHQREFAAEAASQDERTTAEAEAPRVDRSLPSTRGGGER